MSNPMLYSLTAPDAMRLKTSAPACVSSRYWVLVHRPPVASGYSVRMWAGSSSRPTSRISSGLPMTAIRSQLLCELRTFTRPARSASVLANAPGWMMSSPSSTMPKTDTIASIIPSASSTFSSAPGCALWMRSAAAAFVSAGPALRRPRLGGSSSLSSSSGSGSGSNTISAGASSSGAGSRRSTGTPPASVRSRIASAASTSRPR